MRGIAADLAHALREIVVPRLYRLLGSGPEFHISCVAAGSSALHRMLVDAVERGMERLRSLDIVAPPQP